MANLQTMDLQFEYSWSTIGSDAPAARTCPCGYSRTSRSIPDLERLACAPGRPVLEGRVQHPGRRLGAHSK